MQASTERQDLFTYDKLGMLRRLLDEIPAEVDKTAVMEWLQARQGQIMGNAIATLFSGPSPNGNGHSKHRGRPKGKSS